MSDPTMLERIELTAGELRSRYHYDPETGIFTRKHPRNTRWDVGSVAGGKFKDGRNRIKIDGKFYLSARLAWLYMTGEWPIPEADHENRNVADDRWENLREATRAQNIANRLTRAKSGFKGVGRKAGERRWSAKIRRGGKQVSLGRFDTAEAAHAAYITAAREQWGEFVPCKA